VLAVGAAVAANAQGSGKKEEDTPYYAEPAPEPIDVSIPYDAAALLAYTQAKGIKADDVDDIDMGEFEKFKALYEEKTVYEVTAKKKARDLAAFQAEAEKKAKELAAFGKS